MLSERIEKCILRIALMLFVMLLFFGSHRFLGVSEQNDIIDHDDRTAEQVVSYAISAVQFSGERAKSDAQLHKRLKKAEPQRACCSTTPSSVCGNRVPSDANGNILLCSRYKQAVYRAFPPENGFS